MKLEDMIKGVFAKSYKLFSQQFVVFIVASLLALFGMIFIITIPPLFFSIYYMAVQLSKGKTLQISDVWKGFGYFWTSWGMFIVAFVLVVLGLVLLVIPGLFLMVVFQYAIALAILEGKGAINALKRSYAIGKQNLVFSIALFILILLIETIGGWTRIGVLITIPFTSLCIVIATQELTKGKK